MTPTQKLIEAAETAAPHLDHLSAYNALKAAIDAAKQEQPQCRRYMDDFPGARADCEYQIAKGKRCSDCPKQEQQAEPVLTVEREPDYWNGGHHHEGYKSWVNPTKVWSLPIGTKLYTHPPAQQAAQPATEVVKPVKEPITSIHNWFPALSAIVSVWNDQGSYRPGTLDKMIAMAEADMNEWQDKFSTDKWPMVHPVVHECLKRENDRLFNELSALKTSQPAPEVPSADPQPKWLVHISGPDDVLKFKSEFAALRHANEVNKGYLRDRMNHPDDEVLCVAVVKHVDEIEGVLASSPPAQTKEHP